MKISIIKKSISDCLADPILLKQLRNLTLSSPSGMNYELDKFEKMYSSGEKIRARVYLAYTSHVQPILIGWALLSQVPTDFIVNFTPSKNGKYLFYVYVHNTYRGLKVGTKLLNRVRLDTNYAKMIVCPWESTSRKFFKKNEGVDLQAHTPSFFP